MKEQEKKTREIILAISSLLLFCASCQMKHNQQAEFTYHAVVDEVRDSVPFEDIVDSYRIIPLQTVEGYRIGDVSDLIVTDSLMYVVSEGLYCFNKTGTFKFAINRKGHAKDEYVKITSVNITDGGIYVYDSMQGKILIFDALNGNFCKKIDMPYTVAKVFCNKRSITADCSTLTCSAVSKDERLFVCSIKHPEEILGHCFGEDEYKIPFSGQTTNQENGFFFSNYWRCQTWKVGEKGCIPYIQMILPPEYSLEESQIQSLVNSNRLSSESLENSNKIWGLVNVHENDCIITGDFCVGSSIASFVFDKKNNCCVALKSVKNEGPWQPVPMFFISAHKNKTYRVISSDDVLLIRQLTGLPSLPKNKDRQDIPYDIFCSVEEGDNPVVVEYTLK